MLFLRNSYVQGTLCGTVLGCSVLNIIYNKFDEINSILEHGNKSANKCNVLSFDYNEKRSFSGENLYVENEKFILTRAKNMYLHYVQPHVKIVNNETWNKSPVVPNTEFFTEKSEFLRVQNKKNEEIDQITKKIGPWCFVQLSKSFSIIYTSIVFVFNMLPHLEELSSDNGRNKYVLRVAEHCNYPQFRVNSDIEYPDSSQ